MICRQVFLPIGSFAGNNFIPAATNSSLYIIAIAKACGICHKKRIVKRMKDSKDRNPVAADQPINGGIAPGIAPIILFKGDLVLSGV